MVAVKRARFAGACYGVKRALEMAETASQQTGTVQSLGPLIHNPSVVSHLQQAGVSVADSVSDITADRVIIRSHGVGPQVRRKLDEKDVQIIDATCPHVFRAQQAAAEVARDCGTVIVVGDAKHPEVEGLREYAEQAGGQVFIVGSADSLPDDLPDAVGVIVQTTQNRALFDAVIAALHARGIETEVRDTICTATMKRQAAAAELARQVDALVVIGGHNSSNTTRLFEICKKICPKTVHIESASELDPAFFDGCDAVGVTAGASTPEDQIIEVMDYLRDLS
ncbi:MAG: 4-hydroxy-3-methylbut-2-enyl diphosphate reductase [Eggerthellaceae bacterium]|jgi:4-hydroxy-3-methylbut-2-enyl diphosphate reductase